MEYDSFDFFKALQGYGELEYDDIVDLNNGKPLVINGLEVESILDDDGLKFSYIGEDDVAYSRTLYLDDIDEELCDKIYEFLCDNRNTNTYFF